MKGSAEDGAACRVLENEAPRGLVDGQGETGGVGKDGVDPMDSGLLRPGEAFERPFRLIERSQDATTSRGVRLARAAHESERDEPGVGLLAQRIDQGIVGHIMPRVADDVDVASVFARRAYHLAEFALTRLTGANVVKEAVPAASR